MLVAVIARDGWEPGVLVAVIARDGWEPAVLAVVARGSLLCYQLLQGKVGNLLY